jgi:transposase
VLVQSGQAFAGLEAFLDPPALTGDRDQRGQPHPARADQQTYAKRNTVERGYLRLKQWRGIATRYDKHALTFLGVTFANTVIHLRIG